MAGEVRSKGTELDVQGTILPGWNVILAYTNQDVRITKSYPGDTNEHPRRVPTGNAANNCEPLDELRIPGRLLEGIEDRRRGRTTTAPRLP